MSLPARLLGFSKLQFASEILQAEAAALQLVATRLESSFEAFVDRLAQCKGRVAVTGIGKSADVGQKLVGTLNSTGTRAYLLDATRAVHGDLGMMHPDDIALLLSHSGESEELIRLLPSLRKLSSGVLAMTGQGKSTLARQADHTIVYGPITEACPLSLAPSTSTTVMIALGDAIAFTLSELRQFTSEQFAQFHPAGSLGRKLATVDQYMRRGQELRIASATATIREVFAQVRHMGRRTGAVMLVDHQGELAGLFTDSDLARLFERRADDHFDQAISNVMTPKPITLNMHSRMSEALELFRTRKISEIPIIDEQSKPIGILDITDLIGVDPEDEKPTEPRPRLRVIRDFNSEGLK
jgi:arabinose-5-phosphate isomerase